MDKSRRLILRTGVAVVPAFPAGAAVAVTRALEVWKVLNYGCCSEWIGHLEANGSRAR